MIPIMQTDTDSKTGNCMTACLASILRLRIEDVPNWAQLHEDDAEMWHGYVHWLWNRGLQNICLRGKPVEQIIPAPVGQTTASIVVVDGWGKSFVIVHGASPRGEWGHVCVGQYQAAGNMLKIVHDPHPDQTGLKAIEMIEILVPIRWGER